MSSEPQAIPDPPSSVAGLRGLFVCGMSRCGTTLLSTILDSHPDVAMGYEMLPTGLGPIAESARILQECLAEVGDDASAIAQRLHDRGRPAIGRFVRQADRTAVPPTGVLECLEHFASDSRDPDSIAFRASISSWIVGRKAMARGCRHAGFKINAPSVEAFVPHLPEGRFVFIARDPRDVLASHVAANFDRTPSEVATAWSGYVTRFLAFRERHPDIAFIVRYEDLVGDPDGFLPELCRMADVTFDPAMRRFFASNASVHASGHRNRAELERDFFTTSVGRWRRDVGPEDRRLVETTCGPAMETLGYDPTTTTETTMTTTSPEPRKSWWTRLRG